MGFLSYNNYEHNNQKFSQSVFIFFFDDCILYYLLYFRLFIIYRVCVRARARGLKLSFSIIIVTFRSESVCN